MEKTLAREMQDTLGVEWMVDEIGYRECPRYLYRLYKRCHWWIFSYWGAIGVMEHSNRKLRVVSDADFLQEKLRGLVIRVVLL